MQRPLSFEAFYRAERTGVLRAVHFTIDDRDLATEATDEAFARAFERWSSIESGPNPVGWVYRVALNVARNRFRRLALERRRPGPISSPVEVVDGDGDGDVALAAALRRLSEEHRAVIVLRYHLDWSVEDVAAALAVAPGTVKSRLHRALEKLANLLEEPS